MGQGGAVNLINNTRSKLIQAEPFFTYQMDAWDFPKELEAGEKARFYVEWSEGFFEDRCDDRGIAKYVLENDPKKKVKIEMWDATKRNFTVERTGFSGDDSRSTESILWQHDGDMFIVISDDASKLDFRCWMKGIAGNTPLNKMDIPGTHDSLSYDFTGAGSRIDYTAKTQSYNIWEQLNNGCRYFDIRIDADLRGCHWIIDCVHGLEDFMTWVNRFLNDNPSETIIVRLKNERDVGVDDKKHYNELLSALFEKYKHLFWKSNGQINWPLLDDVRGKIVVLDNLNEHFFSANGYGFVYGDNAKFVIQDNYNAPNEDDKIREIKANIDLPYDSERMKINHISATGTTAGFIPFTWTPRMYADFLNPKVTEFIITKRADCVMGIIVFDFVNSQLVSSVLLNDVIG
ncbi:phosphatidylinositol-specific phospholipase C domain-containing protein [Ruminococcus albus]|uniref:1-phosphatidylinositol phosphodiesterase n=1 Tax=Ruminococcus albus (strain ATCC 27210 / DSM 20455 / JCM 14654 / NCDO 2250 / 7) TaxID=697329 RepID=E6UK87_RUMA7|nr:phosphatidylinositol-specific phospholipase C domain-containing protein [Ruminococcus albus]ADU24083.1 phosphatidylinositol-specific phospholipase C X region [Ruminococcus albus 7 = DSM 20455]